MPTRGNAGPRGTGFIDFNRYLEVNRPQAEAMAGRIADPIAARGAEVESDIAAASSGTDGILERYGSGDLDQFTDDELRAMGAGNYAIPGYDPQKFTEAGKKATDVASKANLTGSVGGVASLIQEGKPKDSTYSLGMNMLDAGLAGAAGGERFQQLRGQYGGLFGKVTDAAKTTQEKVKTAQDSINANPGLYSGELKVRETVRKDAEDRPRQEAEAAEKKRIRDFNAARFSMDPYLEQRGKKPNVFGSTQGGRG